MEENDNNKNSIDEKTLKLQRRQRLEILIEKRKNNFNYLINIHCGDSYWLNSVLIDKKQLNYFISEKIPLNRSISFYYFGLSLYKILELNDGYDTVKGLLQLLEEWEYYFSSNTMQSMKYVMSRTSNYYYPLFMPNENDFDQLRCGIYKFNNDIVYEYLQTPDIPFELNYTEVFINLCEMLSLVYDKFWHKDSSRSLFSLFLYLFRNYICMLVLLCLW